MQLVSPQTIDSVIQVNYPVTVKPVLSGHRLLSGQYPKSLNAFPLFTLYETFIKRTPLLSGHRHLKIPKMVISIVANLY